ncbi:MAG: hypothetical protein KBE86_10465, partial [Chitinophagales bacterium]|nr:hypothetical protein [Chitinophagales bacterium]
MLKSNSIFLNTLILCLLFSTSLHSQMVMDMDCTGDEMDPMTREHCKVMALVPICCATQTAIANGNWFSGSTWSSGNVPVAGENVYIPDDITITYNGSSNEAINWLRING